MTSWFGRFLTLTGDAYPALSRTNPNDRGALQRSNVESNHRTLVC